MWRASWACAALTCAGVRAEEVGAPTTEPTGRLPTYDESATTPAADAGSPAAARVVEEDVVIDDVTVSVTPTYAETAPPTSAVRDLPPGFETNPPGSAITAGHYHTCALRYTPGADFGGTAQCWGMDEFRQSSGAPIDHFVQISAGHFHTCGVTVSETVACWGGDQNEVLRPTGLFQQVSAGQFHSCGLTKDGEARCWGQDLNTGAILAPAGKFVQIGAGDGYTCAIRPTGLVECWGKAKRKETGPPADVPMVQISVSTSSRHACGLTYDGGDLVCWGLDTKGEAPAFVKGPFFQVATGYRTTCLIAADQENVDCMGASGHHFNTRDKYATGKFQRNRTWDEVTVGRDHICAVESDGELFCFGQPLTGARDVPQGFAVA